MSQAAPDRVVSLPQVMRHSEQLSSCGKIVAEFVPPSSYISSQLLEYLSRRNAALATLQTKVGADGSRAMRQ